jgi:uncharacterized protein (TIGR04255 family)
MARVRHLRNAPIAEAVIDVRIRSREGLLADRFSNPPATIRERYPKTEPIIAAARRPAGLIPPGAADTPAGVFFKTMDDLNVVQFRSDGFTFNRLPPYTSWEDVFPEAMQAWQEYRRLLPDQARIVRVAARYINRLRFTLPAELSAFLTAPPSISLGLPQVLRGYLTRLVLADPQTSNSVVVTQALEQTTDPQHVIVLLDVDAYRDVDLELQDETLAEILTTLHDLKNQVFFGSITEQTAEMYE